MQPIRNVQLAVSTASIEICPDLDGQKARTDIIIRNSSPNVADVITLALGKEVAVANSGIVLKQGEVWTNSTDISNPCWQGAIQGICATVNGLLSIMEK